MDSDFPPQANFHYPAPRSGLTQRFNLEFERPVTSMKMSSRYELDKGPIKSVEIPESWSYSEEFQAGLACLTKFAMGEGASVRVLESLRPLSEDGIRQFQLLLAEQQQFEQRKHLSVETICRLTEVLGPRQAGDNQYTNLRKCPDKLAPVFNLINAQLIKIHEKLLLEVEGIYLNEAGEPLEYYRGVFCPTDQSCKYVLEIFLVASNRREFLLQESAFRRFLNSIRWRE